MNSAIAACKDRQVDARMHHKPLTMHERGAVAGGCVSRKVVEAGVSPAFSLVAPNAFAVRRSTRKFVTAGGDRGLQQLPKRSRNFSNVRTLNLI